MVFIPYTLIKKVKEDTERIRRTGRSSSPRTPPPSQPTEIFGVPFKEEPKTEVEVALAKAAETAPLPPTASILRDMSRDLEKDKKAYSEYQSVLRQQQEFYQRQLDSGEMTEAQANAALNKATLEFQKGTYEQRGYKVTEIKDEQGNPILQLEKETVIPPQKVSSTTKLDKPEKFKLQDIFLGTGVLKLGSRLFPTGTTTTVVGEDLGFLTPSTTKITTKTKQYGFIEGIIKRIQETEKYKEFKEKNTWISNPITVVTPIGKRTITPEKANIFMRNLGLGLFFSPAMATGASQQVAMEAGYEFVGYTKDGRIIRRNLLTGKLEVQQADVWIGGTQGVYKARFGGKEYLVYPSGKIVPVTTEKPIVKIIGAFSPKPSTTTSTLTPSMVGGTGTQGTSLWTGTGQYEVSSFQVAGNIKGAGSILGSLSNQQNILESQVPQTKTIQSNIPIVSFSLKKAQSPIQPQPTKNVLGSATGLIQPQPTKQIQPLPSALLQPQVSVSKSKLLTKTTTAQVPFKTFEITKPITIKKTYLSLFPTKPKKTSKEIFGAFVKRYKKDISLGSFKELKGAKTKLVKELKTTLGASGFVTKGKSKVPFEELDLGYEFTPSKKDMFRVVQKRKFRLGTRSEVSEILSAKRIKGRKIKWL